MIEYYEDDKKKLHDKKKSHDKVKEKLEEVVHFEEPLGKEQGKY